MTMEEEYILGTDVEEMERLRFQHEVWAREVRALVERVAWGPGNVLLDLGCGPGFTSIELARVVGPRGRVVARDQSPRFLRFLEAESRRLSLGQIAPEQGSVESLDPPPGTFDGAFARWLFCWLPDPGAVLERVARSLRSGGVLAIQDYLSWGAMKTVPRSSVFDGAVAACMRSWAEGVGEINIAERLPDLAYRSGWSVELFEPIARLGAVGSPEWRWLGEFFQAYLPKLVRRGLYAADELARFVREWNERSEEGRSYCFTPIVANVVLAKP